MPPTVPADYVSGITAGDPAPAGLPERERRLRAAEQFYARSSAYGAMMVTRPQTIGYGLADSPVDACRVHVREDRRVDLHRRRPGGC